MYGSEKRTNQNQLFRFENSKYYALCQFHALQPVCNRKILINVRTIRQYGHLYNMNRGAEITTTTTAEKKSNINGNLFESFVVYIEFAHAYNLFWCFFMQPFFWISSHRRIKQFASWYLIWAYIVFSLLLSLSIPPRHISKTAHIGNINCK